MIKNEEILLEALKDTLKPATGCTEPVAVAYSAATAKAQLDGEIRFAEIYVDEGIYKNAVYVGIPGIKERGLEVAAALGFVIGTPEKELRIFEDISEECLEKALKLVEADRIKVSIANQCDRLYIETHLETSNGKVRVVTLDKHNHIESIEKETSFERYVCPAYHQKENQKPIQSFSLEEIVEFVEDIPIEKLQFIEKGIELNIHAARVGLKSEHWLGSNILKMVHDNKMSDDMVSRAQILCAAASEARMTGIRFPVMSVSGSGNHGLTVFLTNMGVADKAGTSNEKLLRALALSSLLTVYIKSFTGVLSAMCGCGVAAGIAASAGVVYQLGGSVEAMYGAMLNMVGSITGMICDGGKEGCAYKLTLASGWAVQSALFAMNHSVIHDTDGICVPEFRMLFEHMGHICNPGMIATNSSILDILIHKNRAARGSGCAAALA